MMLDTSLMFNCEALGIVGFNFLMSD